MKNRDSSGLTSYQIKKIAIFTMVIDHAYKMFFWYIILALSFFLSDIVAYYLTSFFFGFTRITFPIFAYFIAEGCVHTHNKIGYIKRLLLFAILSEIPFQLMICIIGGEPLQLQIGCTNVFFTLLLGALSVMGYEEIKKRTNKKWIAYLAFLIGMAISYFIQSDYALCGVLLIAVSYIGKTKKEKLIYMGLVIVFYGLLYLPFMDFLGHNLYILYIPIYIWNCISMSASLLLLRHYNGERGKPMKTFFYMFYPVHIGVLLLLYWFVSSL